MKVKVQKEWLPCPYANTTDCMLSVGGSWRQSRVYMCVCMCMTIFMPSQVNDNLGAQHKNTHNSYYILITVIIFCMISWLVAVWVVGALGGWTWHVVFIYLWLKIKIYDRNMAFMVVLGLDNVIIYHLVINQQKYTWIQDISYLSTRTCPRETRWRWGIQCSKN